MKIVACLKNRTVIIELISLEKQDDDKDRDIEYRVVLKLSRRTT